MFLSLFDRSSLFCRTSARYKQQECDRSKTSATTLWHERHQWETKKASVNSVKKVWKKWKKWLECDTNETIATRVKNFDFDNDTSENIFSYPEISYMASERLQREELFHSQNYLLEMPRSHAKIRLKSAPQNLNFVMAKAISKSYTLDCSCKCPCTFPHNYA